MINEIMDAIAIKLHEVYGDEYEIHQNDKVCKSLVF